MAQIIKIIQIVLAVLLTFLVMIQSSKGGLSSMVSTGAAYHSKRGLEKVIFFSTIIFGILFSVNSLLLFYIIN